MSSDSSPAPSTVASYVTFTSPSRGGRKYTRNGYNIQRGQLNPNYQLMLWR